MHDAAWQLSGDNSELKPVEPEMNGHEIRGMAASEASILPEGLFLSRGARNLRKRQEAPPPRQFTKCMEEVHTA